MKSGRLLVNTLAVALAAGLLAAAAHAQVPFEKLPQTMDASVPRDEQISIALSAAPPDVARNATVYVLGAKGFEIAREGTNGVSCMVDRHFVKSGGTTVEPMCWDAEGSRTTMLAYVYGEELRSKGTSEDEIRADIASGYKDGRFKAPAKPGLLYMLSPDNRLGPTPDGGTAHFPPHVMFYAPYLTGKDLGYASDAPFLVKPGEPDALLVVVPDPKMQGML
jgi:hypothetical protein